MASFSGSSGLILFADGLNSCAIALVKAKYEVASCYIASLSFLFSTFWQIRHV